jgi:GNAT superfamily N-acetyltransferase
MWGSPYLAAQAAYLEHLGTAPGAEARAIEGLYAVRTRVRSNAENGVLSGADAQVTPALAERLAGWFAEWDVPASWLAAEGPARREAAVTLEVAGYRPERAAWEMRADVAALDLDAAIPDARVRIERIASVRALAAWLDVAGACLWFESSEGRSALHDLYAGLGFASSAPLRHYVAVRGDTAVGMASAFFAGTTVVLASLAVLPTARREGIGRTLARARLREARGCGCAVAVLAPSPDGAELYESLGFESHQTPPDRWFYAPFRRVEAES